MTIGNKRFSRINNFFYSLSVFWAPLLIYLILGCCVLWMVLGIGYVFHINFTMPYVLIGIAISILLGIFWGIYRACTPQTTHYQINAPILIPLWKNKKIVMFSDSHLGMVRNQTFAKKIVHIINKERPDMVIIAGDLIDGPVIPYKTTLAPLRDINAPLGTFYTAGNHDEYNTQQKEYYEALTQYVTVLNDARIEINGTQLIGLAFAHETLTETADKLIKTGYQINQPSIVILHDPKNTQALVANNVALVLSGHTHGGQFFPFTLIVHALYKKLAKGLHYFNNTAAITSVGIGTAGPLFRLGTRPEIVVITFS